MSEQTPGAGPTGAPPVPSPKPPASDNQGSLWGGIGLAWLVMVVGELLVGPRSFTLWPLPPLGILVWAIVLLVRGTRTRTGKGLLLGLASIVAVLVLLVAACFGLLFSGGGFHP